MKWISMSNWFSLVVMGLLALSACSPPQLPRGTYEVEILNRTRQDVCEARLSPHNQQAWGGNLLNRGVMRSGDRSTLRVPVGMYDFQFIVCDTAEPPMERYGVMVEGDMLLPLMIGYPPGSE